MGSPPVATARVAPAGIKLDDGYQTLLSFANDSNIEFWEKTVQPPGYEGGDPIDTTTMHNVTFRTMASRALITMTPSTVTAAYDPICYDAIRTLINVEQVITVTFPDGSTIAWYGFLQTWEPQDNEEGAQPECSLTVVPTNNDPSDGSEQAPVLVNAPST